MARTKKKFDLLVIGTGPAGEAAAINAAKAGKSVAIVSDKDNPGGSCTYLGTIPSKAIRYSVKQVLHFHNSPLFRDLSDIRRLTFVEALKHAERVMYEQGKSRSDAYDRNNVPIFKGTAHFLDDRHIQVEAGKSKTKLEADKFIIATGSRPYRPDDVDFDHPLVFDSDTILQLEHHPKKVTIIGAGVIGCEYASIFAGMKMKVEMINPAESLLSFLDTEITDALSYHLQNMGVRCRHQEHFSKLEYHDDHVVTYLESGKKIKSDILLWANGRTGNTDKLGLENVGLKADSRGRLKVNKQYQTAVENIYAAGDVIGWPSLASAAYDQGRAASDAVLENDEFHHVKDVATGIYTIPEISTVGYTEVELTEKKIPYEVGKAFFRNIARAQITGDEVGMLKIIFHFETLEILGIHCFGYQASEIVHIGQAIMNQRGKANTLKYFINTTFNYPTMAEAYKVAALNGMNRLF